MLYFCRMRSEGFPFIVGGLGVGAVFAWLASRRRLSSSLVVSRPRVVVVASQICCHWGKLLQVTFHGCVTCQFAPLFHCDLHDTDMSRKKRDAFRCTGAAFCGICRLLRSSIGISVWRVVFGVLDVAVPLRFAFQGVASKLGFRDKSQLKWRF